MIAGVVELAAAHLGNTAAVCRSSYVHPSILSYYGDGGLDVDDGTEDERLRPEEAQFIAFLARGGVASGSHQDARQYA
jgi:DNA topoisomerase IB